MKSFMLSILLLLIVRLVVATTLLVPSQYATIQAGIDAAQNGDTVLVANGTYTGAGNKNIDFLGKEIVVISENGPETCIIDCEDSSRGFYFHSGEDRNSVLSGFTITNGQLFSGSYWDDSGGGILTYDCSPTIENCLIINNNAYYDGGGIFCYYGAPVITGCIIRGNTSYGGGGIMAIYASPRIENCTIDSNLVFAEESGGGGICCGDNTTISNCTITHNSANEWMSCGGGIQCWGNVVITDCYISGNSAEIGGGIFCTGAVTSSNCMITGNSGVYSGGFSCAVGATPRVIDCVISGNYAGGIEAHESQLFLSGTNISFNIGGGIFNDGSSTITFDHINRCSIYSNWTYSFGNDLYWYNLNPAVIIVDTFTVMNPTNYYAYPIENFTFDILHAYITPVSADLYVSPEGSNSNSGLTPDDPLRSITFAIDLITADSLNPHSIFLAPGIYSPNTTGEVYPLNWKDYIALEGSGQDSSILDGCNSTRILSVESVSGIRIEDVSFINGYFGWGGGVCLSNTDVIMTNCSFINNNGQTQGGAIYAAGAALDMSYCYFEGNWASDGGAIYANIPPGTISYCTFNSNSAGDEGGAIRLHAGDPLITNCTFNGNSAADFGEGIYVNHFACPQIESCIFIGNSAEYGGGIDIYNSPNPTISNCTFDSNSASVQGGGVFTSFNSLTFINTTFSHNYAGQSGGGLFFLDAHPVFNAENRCNIYANSAGLGYGNDISSYYNYTPDTIDVIVDTFTVLNPTDYHAHPIEHFTFDIQNSYLQLNLVITVSGNDVILSWTEIPNAVIYRIYRSSEPYFTITGMTPIASVVDTSYIDINALNENRYFYRVTYEY